MLSTKQRQVIIYVLIILLSIIVFAAAGSYFLQSTITVISSSPQDQISVGVAWPLAGIPPKNQTQNGNRMTVRVWPGKYTVSASNGASSNSQVVSIGFLENKTIHATISDNSALSSALTPVTSIGVYKYAVSESNIQFIDFNNAAKPLELLDNTSNYLSVLDNTRVYHDIKWADPTFGIANVDTHSTSNQFAMIKNQKINDIALPFTSNDSTSYAVAPDKTWYITDGSTVYRANSDGSFTIIYKAQPKDSVEVVTAGNKALLLTEKPLSKPRSQTIISLNGDGTKYQIDGEFYDAAWSPSGNKLIVSGDEQTSLFDSKLNIIKTLPAGNFAAPIWKDDNTLLYLLGTDIWQYSLQTQSATKIISAPTTMLGQLSTFSFDPTYQHLYVSTVNDGGDTPVYGLYRADLTSQSPEPSSPTTVQLTYFLPYKDSNCSANFINFTTTTLVYSQLSPQFDCIGFMNNYMKTYFNIDPSSFVYERQ